MTQDELDKLKNEFHPHPRRGREFDYLDIRADIYSEDLQDAFEAGFKKALELVFRHINDLSITNSQTAINIESDFSDIIRTNT